MAKSALMGMGRMHTVCMCEYRKARFLGSSPQAEVVAWALVQGGHLVVCDRFVERPHHAHTTVFPVPKNWEIASFIVNSILVNENTILL